MGMDFYCRFPVPSPFGGRLGWGEEPVKVYASPLPNPLPEGEGTTGGNPYQFLIRSSHASAIYTQSGLNLLVQDSASPTT
jgi:hypothetical protein